MKFVKIFSISLLFLPFFAANSAAQGVEIAPYAGGFWSDELGRVPFEDVFDDDEEVTDRSRQLKREGIYGVQAGGYLTERFLLQANLGYINHFELRDTDPESRGILWEALGTVHFPLQAAPRLQPYLSAGVGGLTAVIGDLGEGFTDDDPIPADPTRRAAWDDGDTWFNFSYGGGLKAVRLWGPVGVMADFRGRTLPNFVNHESMTWFEAKGGLTFTFGEQ